MPGAGHIVHMPAHVYLRVGRYEDAARANIAAVEADNRYFEKREVAGAYPMFYAPHNLHFLWSAYQFSGQRAKALGAARALNERVSLESAKAIPSLQVFMPSLILTHARFRDWNAVLAEPAPDKDLRFYRGMWHYARGLARIGKGDVARALTELDSVRAISKQLTDDVIIVLNPGNNVLRLASEVLAGEIASAQKRYDQAIAHFQTAVRIEDSLTFDEPPAWYHPTRQFLGETLLKVGRAAEAEKAFREDLFYQRETGWSLSGLSRALRAQGKVREANQVAQRFQAAWRFADVPVN
jgi:tetratricopeptide (TPR) repeat protein